MNRSVFLVCILVLVSSVLSSCGLKTTRYVGHHRVEIVEPHRRSGHSRLTTMPNGRQIFTYESDTVKVRLENEVLTVNGKKYVLAHKDDFIRIAGGRVEINGQPAKPEEDSGGSGQ